MMSLCYFSASVVARSLLLFEWTIASQVIAYVCLELLWGWQGTIAHESVNGLLFDLLVWEGCGFILQWEMELLIQLTGQFTHSDLYFDGGWYNLI